MTSQSLTFVVGTGRCGSTALSRVLRLHPHVLSLSELVASMEPQPFPEEPLTGAEFWGLLTRTRTFANRILGDGIRFPEFQYPEDKGRFSVRDGGIPAIMVATLPHLSDDPDALYDEIGPRLSRRPLSPVAEHYRALFDLLVGTSGRHAVVERSGFSLRSIPRLRELFPEARFVHLFRNGPDCALSMSRHPTFRVMRLMTEKAMAAGANGEQPDEVLAAGLRDLLENGSFDLRAALQQPVPVADFGMLWSQAILEGLAHLEALPADIRMQLCFDDLLDDPDARLKALAAHLGIEPLPQWQAAARELLDGSRRGAADALPADERAALAEACAPGMRALGLN